MLRRFALAFAVAMIAIAAILFAALNRQHFEIDIAFVRFEVSSGLALLITFSAGLLAGAWWRSNWIVRLLAERGRLRDALRLAEARRPPGHATHATAETAPTDAA